MTYWSEWYFRSGFPPRDLKWWWWKCQLYYFVLPPPWNPWARALHDSSTKVRSVFRLFSLAERSFLRSLVLRASSYVIQWWALKSAGASTHQRNSLTLVDFKRNENVDPFTVYLPLLFCEDLFQLMRLLSLTDSYYLQVYEQGAISSFISRAVTYWLTLQASYLKILGSCWRLWLSRGLFLRGDHPLLYIE